MSCSVAETSGPQGPSFSQAIHPRSICASESTLRIAGLAEQSDDLQYSGELVCMDMIYEG